MRSTPAVPTTAQRFSSLRLFWRQHQATAFPLLVFLLLRLLTAVVAGVVALQYPIQPPDWIYLNATGATYTHTLPPGAPFYALSLPWHHYDTLWYTKAALYGYQNDPGIVFLPLYPLLIRLVFPLTAGNLLLASLIVSNAACAAAFLLFYRLVSDEFDSAAARRALLCLAAFPTAYYLLAGYTESLFLALALGAFVLARRGHWGFVGLLACLTALTRLQGIILSVPLAWLAYREKPPLRDALARLPAVIGAPLGTGLYLLMLSLSHLGSPDQYYASEWHSSTQLPWVSVARFVERWLNGQTLYYEGDNAVILLVFAALGLFVLWKFKPYLKFYVAVTLVILLMRAYDPDRAQFESMFRYALLLFPCFIALGLLLRHRLALSIYVVVGLAWQCLLLSRFVQWIWVA